MAVRVNMKHIAAVAFGLLVKVLQVQSHQFLSIALQELSLLMRVSDTVLLVN